MAARRKLAEAVTPLASRAIASATKDQVATTSFRMTAARHRQMKMVAAERGTTLQRMLEEGLELWLKQNRR